MDIFKATADQYQNVRGFYHRVIDGIAEMTYGAGWIKDVYPSPEFLRESIDNSELFIATEGEKIVAAMVLNHSGNESYREYSWPTAAADFEVTVIHALGVAPEKAGTGYGRKMVEFAIDTARLNRQKVIRLDVLKGNVPAERLYPGIGFRYLHTLPMYYADTGWTDFELYEYVL